MEIDEREACGALTELDCLVAEIPLSERDAWRETMTELLADRVEGSAYPALARIWLGLAEFSWSRPRVQRLPCDPAASTRGVEGYLGSLATGDLRELLANVIGWQADSSGCAQELAELVGTLCEAEIEARYGGKSQS